VRLYEEERAVNTIEEIRKYREENECSLQRAQEIVNKNSVIERINSLDESEELKSVLLAIVNRTFHVSNY
jgi:hypothetical protein